MPVLSTRPRMATAARSSGRTPASRPFFAKWNGVRAKPAITVSFMTMSSDTVRLLFQRDPRGHRQAGAQARDAGLVGIEADAHRHALYDLGEVAGSRLERQQGEGRARSGREAFDRPGQVV